MEKIIILGAGGNIGSAVLKALQGKQVEVFGGEFSEKLFGKIESFGAKPILVDFNNPDSLAAALQGKDRVFLVTPLMQAPEKVTQLVLEAAQNNGLKHLVRSTAYGADSQGQIQMARWAGASEDLIRAAEIPYTIVRPYSFLQNFINFHSQSIKAHNGFYLPVGDAKASLLDINDMAVAIAEVMTSEQHYGKTYAFSGLTYTFAELADILSKVVGRKISYIDVPEEQARQSMLDEQVPEWIVDASMELNYFTKQGWTAGYSADYKNITGKEYTDAETFFMNHKEVFL